MPYPTKINLARLLGALSRTLDLTSSGLTPHHQAVALISVAMARTLGLPEAARNSLFFSALIHDLGASTCAEKAQIAQFDASPRHAAVGADRLSASSLLLPYAPAVRHHHDRWDGATPGGLQGEDIPLHGRIIHVADRFATLFSGREARNLERARDHVRQIEQQAGSYFDPTLVDCLRQVTAREAFLLDISTGFMPRLVEELSPSQTLELDLAGLRGLAMVFADVIDQKSAYTRKHSQNVAEVAAQLAQRSGFSPREVAMVEIAGLLHDLGKLAVRDEVLDKQGRLDRDEFAHMQQHPYYTFHIVRMVEGLETIAEWAAFHHEKLNGSGYPFRLGGDEISLGARIMAVSDIFAALSEDRPYRRALAGKEIAAELQRMARAGELDPSLVATVEADVDAFTARVRPQV